MAINKDAKVLGLPELSKKLNALASLVKGAVLENALLAGALIIQNAAIENAPYDTGSLRKSIHIEIIERGSNYVKAKIGTDLVYAAIQEFGGTITAKNSPYLVFELRGIDGIDGGLIRVRSVTIPAHPYMRPAYMNNKDAVVNEIKDALLEQINKIAT